MPTLSRKVKQRAIKRRPALKSPMRYGYCTFPNLLRLIRFIAASPLHEGDKITADMLTAEGKYKVSPSDVYLAKSAARVLHLLDDQDCITKRLIELSHASGQAYRDLFKDTIEKGYPEIFLRVQVAYATQEELREAFRKDGYEATTLEKMVSLFKNLCHEAAIIVDKSELPQVESEQITETSSPMSPLDDVPLVLAEDTPMPELSQSNGLHPSQSDITRVKKLVASFVRLDQLARNANWSETTQAMWIDYVRMSYDLLGDVLTQIERTEQ